MAHTRRWFLSALPAACFADNSGRGRILPSALRRYSDPATEFEVFRLTDPAYSSILPSPYSPSISRHGFLICASNSSGRWEAYRIEIKGGQQRQLTAATALDPYSVSMVADERSFVYIDGASLISCNLSNLHTREVYRIPQGFDHGRGVPISEDGLFVAVVEIKNGRYRLQLVDMAHGAVQTLAEGDEEISCPAFRPKRAALLYRRGGNLWLANFDGKQNYRLRLAEGETGPALWSPDGRSVLYLNYPADPHKLHDIREFTPDSNEDKPIADTSQFVGFGRNADASVFAGASGSKASPYVLLLVRSVKRELTLCEHRASDPRMVSPVFSPNSQRVFFSSDRHGKRAIYSMSVERLVEETETQ